MVTETDTHTGRTRKARENTSEDGRLEGYIFKARTPGGAELGQRQGTDVPKSFQRA